MSNPNVCTHCPHTILDIGGGTMFCPCEDCHVGGLVQGREPSALTPNIEPQVTACDETCIKPAGHTGFHQRTAIAPRVRVGTSAAESARRIEERRSDREAARLLKAKDGFEGGMDAFIEK